MSAARQKALLPEAAPVRLYPRAHPLDRLRRQTPARCARPQPPGSGRPGSGRPGSGRCRGELGAVSGLAAAAGLSPQGPLTLPGRWVIR